MAKMRIHLFRFILVATLASLFGNAACAGPVRNWIAEHKAERQIQQDDESESPAAQLQLPRDSKVLKDIAYGSSRQQRMDVYAPPHASNAPVIFMVHGGGWSRGDKAASTVVENKAARWVSRGVVFVSINYRLLPEADPITQAEDVARALAAAQAKAAAWGGDPNKFILMGHSAGAHLVALLSSAPAKAYELGAKPWLGTVSLDSAALDVVQIMGRKHFSLYDDAFGKDAAYWKSASPFHVLTGNAVPMLLVCSSIRKDAPCAQARQYADEATSLGARVEILPQALSHKQINQNLGLPGAYTEAVEHFMGSLDASQLF